MTPKKKTLGFIMKPIRDKDGKIMDAEFTMQEDEELEKRNEECLEAGGTIHCYEYTLEIKQDET